MRPFVVVAALVLLVSAASGSGQKPEEPVKTTLCEILRQPASFNGKLVQFRARVESGVLDLPGSAVDDTCSMELPFMSPDDQHLAGLLKDREFRKLTNYLKKTPLVQATITGWFGVDKKSLPGLVLESVSDVTRMRTGH